MNLSVLKTPVELESLGDEWDRAVEGSAFDSIFATREWFSCWTRHFAPDEPLAIVVARDEGGIAGILPLGIERKRLVGAEIVILRSLTNAHSFKYDFILNRNKGRAVLQEILSFLSREYDWDIISLDFVPEDSASISILRSLEGISCYKVHAAPSVESPYIPLDGTWEAYSRRIGKNLRRSMSQHEKRLERQGRLELVLRDGEGDLEANVWKALEIEKSGWKGRAGTAMAESAEVAAFYLDLAKSASRKNWFALYFLSLEGREIAFDYCLKYKDCLNVLKTGYDQAHAVNSPGKVLRKRILQELFGGRYGIYDFLGSREEWKTKWTAEFRKLSRVLVFNSKKAPAFIYHAMTSWNGLKKKVREYPPAYDMLKRLRRAGSRKASRVSP